ncbi:Anion exchange protein 3, partial [Ophiophagus hannah]
MSISMSALLSAYYDVCGSLSSPPEKETEKLESAFLRQRRPSSDSSRRPQSGFRDEKDCPRLAADSEVVHKRHGGGEEEEESDPEEDGPVQPFHPSEAQQGHGEHGEDEAQAARLLSAVRPAVADDTAATETFDCPRASPRRGSARTRTAGGTAWAPPGHRQEQMLRAQLGQQGRPAAQLQQDRFDQLGVDRQALHLALGQSRAVPAHGARDARAGGATAIGYFRSAIAANVAACLAPAVGRVVSALVQLAEAFPAESVQALEQFGCVALQVEEVVADPALILLGGERSLRLACGRLPLRRVFLDSFLLAILNPLGPSLEIV